MSHYVPKSVTKIQKVPKIVTKIQKVPKIVTISDSCKKTTPKKSLTSRLTYCRMVYMMTKMIERTVMKARGWTVYLNGREIDVVFFDPDCDADYVRRSLIDHDGYDPRIVVKK